MTKLTMGASALVLVLALAGCDSGPSLTPEQQALAQELDAMQVLAQGWEPLEGTSDTFMQLGEGADRDIALTVPAGTSLRIIGTCDAQCGDMDLELIDAAETTSFAKDIETDKRAAIEHVVEAAGDYTVIVSMFSCEADQCNAGVRVLTQAGS